MSNLALGSTDLQATVSLCCQPLGKEELSAADSEKISVIFKALSDPVRLRLFSKIAAQPGGEACVCDIRDVGRFSAHGQSSPAQAARGRTP
ncbi:hypothetical protein SHIRM173S_08085 [Streptomyces hirsutus]